MPKGVGEGAPLLTGERGARGGKENVNISISTDKGPDRGQGKEHKEAESAWKLSLGSKLQPGWGPTLLCLTSCRPLGMQPPDPSPTFPLV